MDEVLVGASFLSSVCDDLSSAPPMVTVSGVPLIGFWAVLAVWLLSVTVVVAGVELVWSVLVVWLESEAF